MRGGARRPHARRSLSTLSVLPRAPTKQLGPSRRLRACRRNGRATRRVQLRGGARRPRARRSPSTLSVPAEGANEADGPSRRRGTEPRPVPAIISRAEAPSMSHDDRHGPDGHVHGGSAPAAAATVIDPVCGMDVEPAQAAAAAPSTPARRTVLQPGCRETFGADPARFLAAARAAALARRRPPTRPTPVRCIPRSRQTGPGSCPMCGMALEPLRSTRRRGGAERRARRHDAAVLGERWRSPLPVFALAMAEMAAPALARRSTPGRAAVDRSCCWRRRSCCGAAGRSSSAAGSRSSRAASTCSR